jgi:hypothetical protein
MTQKSEDLIRVHSEVKISDSYLFVWVGFVQIFDFESGVVFALNFKIFINVLEIALWIWFLISCLKN